MNNLFSLKNFVVISAGLFLTKVNALVHELDSWTVDQFQISWDLLDHNHDGNVSIHEASLGLLTLNQSADLLLHDSFSNVHHDWRLICSDAKPDGPSLIDCVVAHAREIVSEGNSDDILHMYNEITRHFEVANCSDIFPSEDDIGKLHTSFATNTSWKRYLNSDEKSCRGVFAMDNGKSFLRNVDLESADFCQVLSNAGFCKLSCRSCNSMSSDTASDASRRLIEEKNPLESVSKSSGSSNEVISVPVLISGDWHIEPWYAPELEEEIARYSNPTPENMWNCFNTASKSIDPSADIGSCFINSVSDPPLEFVDSHFSGFESVVKSISGTTTHVHAATSLGGGAVSTAAPAEASDTEAVSGVSVSNGLLFYVGDTQAHSYVADYLGTCDEPTAIGQLMGRALDAMALRWVKEDIFISPGNNDGPHSAIFVSGGVDEDSQAWAQQMVDGGIVTDDLGFSYPSASGGPSLSQSQFFAETGYYVKRVDPSDRHGLKSASLFCIMVNTNLGATNRRQTDALNKDLATIRSLGGGGVYILGHHPETTKLIAPAAYADITKGIFSGHTHVAISTTRNLFTQVPGITQIGIDNAFFVGHISSDTNYEIRVSTSRDLYSYDRDTGKGKLTDVSLWRAPSAELLKCRLC